VIFVSDVQKDFVGGGLGVWGFIDVTDESSAGVEASERGAGDGDTEMFLDKVDGLVVGVSFVPGDDLFALIKGEVVEGGGECRGARRFRGVGELGKEGGLSHKVEC